MGKRGSAIQLCCNQQGPHVWAACRMPQVQMVSVRLGWWLGSVGHMLTWQVTWTAAPPAWCGQSFTNCGSCRLNRNAHRVLLTATQLQRATMLQSQHLHKPGVPLRQRSMLAKTVSLALQPRAMPVSAESKPAGKSAPSAAFLADSMTSSFYQVIWTLPFFCRNRSNSLIVIWHLVKACRCGSAAPKDH